MDEVAGGTILVLPIVDWEFRTQRPHHLARHFALAGHPVLYPNLRLGGAHLREAEPGIFRFQLAGRADFDPYREALTPEDVALAMMTLEAVATKMPLDGVWIIAQLPAWLPLAVAARRRFSGALLFDCMDDFVHFGDHGDLGRDEAELARTADLVSASSQALFAKLEPDARRLVLVRNGCEPHRFRPPLVSPPGPPVIGFFGGMHDWFDGELLAAVARRRPDWRFRLIGDTYRGDVDALLAQGNVEFVGELPYAELPAAAATFHVGVVPFRMTPLTRAADPVKVYEMLALGLPVVATPLPELERFQPYVRLAPDAATFEREIELALSEPFARRAERRAVAVTESWTARYDDLRRAMSEVPGARRIGPRDVWGERAALEAALGRAAEDVERLTSEAVARRDQRDHFRAEAEHFRAEAERFEAAAERCLADRAFESAALHDERNRFRADRDAVAGRLAEVTATRWWRLGERYWAFRRWLRRGA